MSNTNTNTNQGVGFPTIIVCAVTLVLILGLATLLLLLGKDITPLMVVLAAAAPAVGTLFLAQQTLNKTKTIEANTNGALTTRDKQIAGLTSALAVATNPQIATTVANAPHDEGKNMQTDDNGNTVTDPEGHIVQRDPLPATDPVQIAESAPLNAGPNPEPPSTASGEPVVLTTTGDNSIVVNGVTLFPDGNGGYAPRPETPVEDAPVIDPAPPTVDNTGLPTSPIPDKADAPIIPVADQSKSE